MKRATIDLKANQREREMRRHIGNNFFNGISEIKMS